nr:ESPR-type extended signal peptide-containing protein [Escherichia coli]
MNRIYSLKYCHITHTIKVVSELTRRVCKKRGVGRRKLLTLPFITIFSLFPGVSFSSVSRGDIPYQTYRDFAENKGKFQQC